MNSNELKKIKKYYGEEMTHFCRDNFATILETENLLLNTLLKYINPYHYFFRDVKQNNMLDEFKGYIYRKCAIENPNNNTDVNKDPKELMGDAGYDLYECKSEDEIQAFKKYYRTGEELCTFRVNRLERCYVYFAVKKNVDEIRREDFNHPARQDLYGTSVISIQFTKDNSHMLSIKNRYNHTVQNPDATFSNNLENIIPGLTKSFSKYYGMHQNRIQDEFELPNYTYDVDGKMYKYNSEYNNVYSCPNNIVIKFGHVTKYDTSRYLVINNFLIDFSLKKISEVGVYDGLLKDIGEVKKIDVNNIDNVTKKVIIINDRDEEITFVINDSNQIIDFRYDTLKCTSDGFLLCCTQLKNISMVSLEATGRDFLFSNRDLVSYNLPNLEEIGDNFLINNESLTIIDFPKVRNIGSQFLSKNVIVNKINLSLLEMVTNGFLSSNNTLTELNLPNLKKVGSFFMIGNRTLTDIELPLLEEIGDYFLDENLALKSISLPNLKSVGHGFLTYNQILESINVPKLQIIKDNFLKYNTELQEMRMNSVVKVGSNFMENNKKLNTLYLPNVEKVGYNFLYSNVSLTELILPSLISVNNDFMINNNKLTKLEMPKIQKIGNNFLVSNQVLTDLHMPRDVEIGYSFLTYNYNIDKEKLKL